MQFRTIDTFRRKVGRQSPWGLARDVLKNRAPSPVGWAASPHESSGFVQLGKEVH